MDVEKKFWSGFPSISRDFIAAVDFVGCLGTLLDGEPWAIRKRSILPTLPGQQIA